MNVKKNPVTCLALGFLMKDGETLTKITNALVFFITIITSGKDFRDFITL